MISKKERVQAEIDRLTQQLAILNRIPEDRFPIGTVAVFATSENRKWYLVKTAEEIWENLHLRQTASLDWWIADTIDDDIEYFEVYELKVQPQPFFASS